MNNSSRIFLVGDNIDTDIIIPTQYMTLPTIQDMCKFAFSPIREDLVGKINKGDILIAGFNFGCGSSREQAPEIIKALGVKAVIAKSFARIFYRNAINNGLLVIDCPNLPENLIEGDRITLDGKSSTINFGNKGILKYPLMPKKLNELLEAGGLVSYYSNKNREDAK